MTSFLRRLLSPMRSRSGLSFSTGDSTSYRVGDAVLKLGFCFNGLDKTLAIITHPERDPEITKTKIGCIIVNRFQNFLCPLELRLGQFRMCVKTLKILLGQGELQFEFTVREHGRHCR